MPDEAPAGLEQPLLQARQRPALDGDGHDEPAQQIAQVVARRSEPILPTITSPVWMPMPMATSAPPRARCSSFS